MGLFNTIASQAAGALSSGPMSTQPGMMDAVIGLLENCSSGGLPTLITAFQEKGLGDIVASWIGSGANLPVSSEQLSSVLGNEKIAALAEKLGLSDGDTLDAIASFLPQIIDKLSPNGQLLEGRTLDQGLALLKSFGVTR